MAATWLDPGGSATGGTQLLTILQGAITAQSSVTNGQAYAYQLSTSSPAAGAGLGKGGVLAAAGRRISLYIRFPAAPGIDAGVGLINCNPSGSGTSTLRVVLDTARKLRLYTNGFTTQLGATGATVLAVDTWYRIDLSYVITSTSNWGAKVYIDGALEMTRTNADGTLSSAVPADVAMSITSTTGTNWLLYASDIYVDDSTAQTDPGDVHVSRRAVTTVSSGAWDSTIGTGSLIERPVDAANRIEELATGPATVDYNVEAASAGDADLTGATLVGRSVYAWYTLSSLTGTPTGKLRMDGTAIGAVMDPASAGTYQSHVAVDTVTTYPSTVGCTSSGLAANTLLAELGAIVAYIPSSGPAPVSVAGDQPAPTGVLTRIKQALRALAGAQPANTGVLTRGVHATARALAGDQPNATGVLTRVKQNLRSLAGDQPSATGTLSNQKITARALAGDQPANTGTLSRILAALRNLTGNQPNPTGVLTRGVHATTRALSGDQPAPTGTLAATKTGLERSLAGDQPAPTGVLTRKLQALRGLTGDQPANTGTLTGVAVGARRAIVSWLELEAPFAIRTLTGNLPSASGTLSRIKQALRSLAGSQPAPTGVLTRIRLVLRSLAGNQPNATGALTRIKQALRALAGNQPNPTGILTRKLSALRALAGSQPNPTGLLTRAQQSLRALTGNQPAPTGTLVAVAISTVRAAYAEVTLDARSATVTIDVRMADITMDLRGADLVLDNRTADVQMDRRAAETTIDIRRGDGAPDERRALITV